MALSAILDSLEGISEELKEHYTEKDGKFFLSVTPVSGVSLEDVTGLRSSLQKERQNVSSLKSTLKTFQDLGKSPEEITEALEKLAASDQDGTLEEKLAALRGQLEDKHSKEISKRDAENEVLLNQLEKALIVGNATSALAKHGGNVQLLLPHVQSRMHLVKNDEGIYSVRVKDPETGVDRLSTTSDSYMTAGELVQEMSKDKTYLGCFKGSDSSGGGGGTNNLPAGGRQPWQIPRTEAQDTVKFRQALAAAEKVGRTAPEIVD